jgi:hypothetical protein
MRYFIAALVILSGVLARASPTPCAYWASPPGPNSAPDYDIAKAYAAADLVVIGHSDSFVRNKPQKVRIVRTIKGKLGRQITLEGIHEAGTDPWGAAISTDGDYLMLLKAGATYSWVDQGSACPNVFKVTKGKVTFGKTQVYIKELQKYFESQPKPLSEN